MQSHAQRLGREQAESLPALLKQEWQQLRTCRAEAAEAMYAFLLAEQEARAAKQKAAMRGLEESVSLLAEAGRDVETHLGEPSAPAEACVQGPTASVGKRAAVDETVEESEGRRQRVACA